MQKLSGLVRKNTVFIFILLLAIFLRVYKLDLLELFGDELDVGYQAYSLLKTGRDYRGNILPIYIESFSESRAPLFLYSTIPFVTVFGLNEWGVRLTAVFWGILDIIFIYLLANYLFKKKEIGLVSAFLTAVIPWHIHYSRAGFEVTLLLFLILSGTYFFLLGLSRKKNLLFLSAILFGLSFYTYNTANIFVPLLLIYLFLHYRNIIKNNLKNIVFSGIILFVILLPLGLKIIQGSASSRFLQISIFSNKKIIESIISKRSSVQEIGIIEKVFHNKLQAWGDEIKNNYLISFSPQFLFINGDPNPRHTVPGFGEIYWILLTPLLTGIYVLIKDHEKDGNLLFGDRF